MAKTFSVNQKIFQIIEELDLGWDLGVPIKRAWLKIAVLS
jgi:hypothetical protein